MCVPRTLSKLSVFHVYGKKRKNFLLYCVCNVNIQNMIVDLGVSFLLHLVFLKFKEAVNGYVIL